MNNRRIITLLFALLPICIAAQNAQDTAIFYPRIYKTANKHAWSRWLYNVTFFNGESLVDDSIVSLVPKKKKNPFLAFNGKYISKVTVVVLDPFGYSVNDFFGSKPTYMERLGNKYHVTSSEKIIRNLLLFKEGDNADPLRLSESERMLRLSPYIFDARLYVYKSSKSNKDTIVVLVVVQDKWSTVTWSAFDLQAPDIKLSENNFLGIGHQFSQGFTWRNSANFIETTGKYGIYNIRKTYIQSNLFYSTTKTNQQIGLSLNRPFYSQLARWAGGFSIIRYNSYMPQPNLEVLTLPTYAVNYSILETWVAKSFPVYRKKNPTIEQRSSLFILGFGISNTTYIQRPTFLIDTNQHYQNQVVYLSNIGFSNRTYYRDRYLFRYGANEDIPEGLVIELLTGVIAQEINPNSLYTGIKFGIGKHLEKIGYCASNLGYGMQINNGSMNNGVLNFSSFYFSDLIEYKRWHFRQFVRYKMINTIAATNQQILNLNGTEMYGFNSPTLSSNAKIVLNLEFVMYSPYKVLGFQFSPVLFLGLASINKDYLSMLHGKIYQAYAIGVLIRNEYLVSNTFQLSIGLYPFMPGSSNYLVKTNPISNYEVRAKDFFISKPERVAYQ